MKYRIYDKENKKFDNWIFCLSNGEICCSMHGGIAPLAQQERYVVQLFTGIEDINGVEIYEGDIVEETWRENQLYSHFPDKVIERSDRFNVVYIAPSFNFPKRCGDQVCVENYKIKVIGNIFENPDLA